MVQLPCSPGRVIMPKRNEENLLIESGTLKVIRTMQESEGSPESDIWTAEVWRLDEVNLNGRVYSTELAQRIVKEGVKTMAYDGHEADWQSGHDFAPAIAYIDNPRIENKCLVVDIHFLESQKDSASVKNIRELYKAGLPIGVSSVGYGSMDQNGVIQDDYEIVRYLDFVAMPAGLVYAKPKNESTQEPKNESTGDPMGDPDPAVAEAARAKAEENFSRILKRR